ncbi:hypothetical protein [Sphingopyxis sp.]|uniref:hypothetical protein n=1 Tax=Sphingopyxis sp. TaxID=1908224 RepID=UPI0040350E7E
MTMFDPGRCECSRATLAHWSQLQARHIVTFSRQAGRQLHWQTKPSQAAMAATREQKYNGKNTDTSVVMEKVQESKFTATWDFEFVEGIVKAFWSPPQLAAPPWLKR